MEPISAIRPSLPPIHSLDMDKYKREEADYKHKQIAATTAANIPSVTAPSSYPSGPPPPYSAANHNTPYPPISAPAPHSETRALPSDEKEHVSQQPKQSLPSLQEALGVNPPAPYQPDHSYASSAHGSQSNPATTPPKIARSSHNMDPPRGTSSHYSPYVPSLRESASYRPQDYIERRRSDYSDAGAYPVQFRPRSPPSATPTRHEGHSYFPSEVHQTHSLDRPVSRSHVAPPGPYGYAKHSSYYTPSVATTAVPPPPPAVIYHPSITRPPPGSQTSYKSERPDPQEHSSDAPYGESVKRHLDLYDFELALNDITEHSTVMLDFSRQYGARLHQTSRSGPKPGTLPAITEVDDLINKSRHTVDALTRMREVLVAQQVAYFQQAQEQRFKSESEAKRNDSIHQSEESKSTGGFAGGEPKKRRGRAAAPGRCHSCNRAETPEWRRGPDGARTLCNACGLHYAKLTRKAGSNKAVIASSSLRPKSQERDMEDA